ncbi:MAG: RNA polymerase sigma factor [Bacillota bacterium]|nr:RNA polymerase sigma factor [Bacillota bacterium]
MDEIKLITSAQSGDKTAFQTLITEYYPNVSKFLLKLTGNEQTAEDLTQETFIKLIRNIEKYDIYGTATFATWLITIAKNTHIDWLRKNKNIFVDIDSIEIPSDVSLEQDVIDKIDIEIAMQNMAALSKEQAEAIRLRHFEHLTLNEIAVMTGTQPKTVKSRIHNGIVKLRATLKGGN